MRKKIFIYLLFTLTITSYLTGQKQGQDVVDSLLTELPKAIDDTNKVNLLYKISFEYKILSPETGVEYANQGLELAKKLNWEIGQVKHYNALMQNYWASGEFDLAIDMYNSAVEIEKSLGGYTEALESKLTSINRTFIYPSSDYTNLTYEIRSYLVEVVKYMHENPSVVLAVTGHSDNFGSFEQNDIRSRDRAEKVVAFLIKNGIEKRRCLANYKGSLAPVASNDSAEGRRKNRRIEIKAIGR